MPNIVTTIETRCKRCYSCIRRCPAKAIRVEAGQAKVIPERCIACGYCVKVCPQKAKKIRDGITHARELLAGAEPAIAILAPSFPAAFLDVQPLQVVGGLKKLGFVQVWETALGADGVARQYADLVHKDVMPMIISSPCPAVVNYIEKYHPELLLVLAPIVSPMIALGRLIKAQYHPNGRVVFIGPCIAKKKEMNDPKVAGVIDEVLTFEELLVMLDAADIDLSDQFPERFDGPAVGLGRSFPLSGGLLETAALSYGVLHDEVTVTEGRDRVLEALEKTAEGKIEARFLDLLFCEGCINGPQMANNLSVFIRRDKVIGYCKQVSASGAEADVFSQTNLQREFTLEQQATRTPTEEEIRRVLAVTGKQLLEDELNCGACGYPSCREKAVAVVQGFAEAEMCLPYMVDKLEQVQEKLTCANRELQDSIDALQKTQQQLVQSEKLASVGQLAAGVAHELNNPLGGISIYAGLLLEKADKQSKNAQDLQKIITETDRCRRIVRGLLDFSRQTRIDAAIVNVNKILSGTLALVTQQALFLNIEVKQVFQDSTPNVYADVGQLQQVFLNIILNAADAMNGRGTLTVASESTEDRLWVLVSFTDTGSGMTPEVMEKIFEPFFTTKPRGQGTGLGLSIAYGIVQKHHGEILVKSRPGHGSTITVKLPVAK
jgi:two-component system, NtrC family, sensor kinase